MSLASSSFEAPIHIFDIDGTLTHVFGEIMDTTKFPTYAFWDLITAELVAESNKLAFAKLAEEWATRTDKGTGEAFIANSTQMLQASIDLFAPEVTQAKLRLIAKQLTLKMIEGNVVRQGAIEFLSQCFRRGCICAFSTGSYEDGAWGFVDALMERNLLPSDITEQVIVSGAIIDWATKKVVHHNVGNNKRAGLEQAFLSKTGSPLKHDNILGIYIDDPEGNDSGLSMLKPNHVFIMQTQRKLAVEKLTKCGHKFFQNWKDMAFSEEGFVFYRPTGVLHAPFTGAVIPKL